jgi:hypothetical protein
MLVAYTTKSGGNAAVDPYLVAFYQEAKTLKPYAYPIKVVGVNNDWDASKNARIQWVNTTGAAKTVTVVAFAAAGTPAGFGTLTIRTLDGIYASNFSQTRGAFGGALQKTALPVNTSGCTGPAVSRITLKNLTGGGYGSTLLAINTEAMNGAYLWEQNATVTLSNPIPLTGESFLLGTLRLRMSFPKPPGSTAPRRIATPANRTACSRQESVS